MVHLSLIYPFKTVIVVMLVYQRVPKAKTQLDSLPCGAQGASRLTLRHWSDDELLPLFEEPPDSWPEDHGKIPLTTDQIDFLFCGFQTWRERISPRL